LPSQTGATVFTMVSRSPLYDRSRKRTSHQWLLNVDLLAKIH